MQVFWCFLGVERVIYERPEDFSDEHSRALLFFLLLSPSTLPSARPPEREDERRGAEVPVRPEEVSSRRLRR